MERGRCLVGQGSKVKDCTKGRLTLFQAWFLSIAGDGVATPQWGHYSINSDF